MHLLVTPDVILRVLFTILATEFDNEALFYWKTYAVKGQRAKFVTLTLSVMSDRFWLSKFKA